MYAQDTPDVSKVVPFAVEHQELGKPKSARQLAQHYNVSPRAIQQWYWVVANACYWLQEADLKVGKSAQTKYTPLCQDLISQFRTSGMIAEEWAQDIQRIHAVHTAPDQSSTSFEAIPVEAEWVRPGSIEMASTTYIAQPILQINVENLTVALPTADTTSLDLQTQQLQSQVTDSVKVLQSFVTADFQAKLKVALAQNSHIVTGLQANAMHQTVQDLGVGKPVEE